MKNYPFHSWVPKPLGILILLLLFVPLFFSGGTYLSNINEMTGGLGALSEQFQLLNLYTFIGMSLVFPFMIPYLRERNAKHIFIGGFLLLLANSATSFVGSYLKMSTPAGNLESATISCWAIPGCIVGLVLSLVMVRREVHFRYLYATGFGLILCANLYMYFHYQTLGVYEHTIVPTLFHYTGMLMLYSVTCAFAMKHIPTRYFVTWLFLMIAVRNVIAPAVGTSVYGNWLQERQQYYVTRLAQDVRMDDPRASFAMTAPVHLQATLVAMKDITGSTVWLCLGSMTLVLLIPYYKEERT